ncbi:MAG: hypothetical protein CL985_05550, partial [Euryarchaeota archaeon]|nr:hypothetical protein [Euryarchaeota archaeon]
AVRVGGAAAVEERDERPHRLGAPRLIPGEAVHLLARARLRAILDRCEVVPEVVAEAVRDEAEALVREWIKPSQSSLSQFS